MIYIHENIKNKITMKKQRESGYYWVKIIPTSKYKIAEYDHVFDVWYITGNDCVFRDHYFKQINEEKIKLPV